MPAAKTVDDYVRSLPDGEREVIATVRDVVRTHLPAGFEESMTWGVPTWEVPLERYPDTYNGKPIGYVVVASKKNYFTLHLMSVYADPALRTWLQNEFDRHGTRLDMGKGCLRFKRLDDLPLDVIGALVAKTSLDAYVARIDAGRRLSARKIPRTARQAASRPAQATKNTVKKAVKRTTPAQAQALRRARTRRS